VLELALAGFEAVGYFAQGTRLNQLAEQHRHKLTPAGKTPAVTLGLQIGDVPREVRAMKKRKDLTKQASGSNHKLSPLMMGLGSDFHPHSHQRRRPFPPFLKT
jgi:hypothetical protein